MEKQPESEGKKIVKIFRMWDWWLYVAVLIAVVSYIAPQQLSVVAYKACLLALAVVIAYLADRSLFMRTSDQIHERMQRDILSACRVISRALIFVGVCIVFGMGI